VASSSWTPPRTPAWPAVCEATHGDACEVSRRLARKGVGLVAIGLDAMRPPRRVLTTQRYDAMEATFDTAGPPRGAG